MADHEIAEVLEDLPMTDIDSSDSDSEYEQHFEEQHSSESELQASSEEEDHSADRDGEFYLGRDNTTMWSKQPYKSKFSRTAACNIVKLFPNAKNRGQNVKDEFVSFP